MTEPKRKFDEVFRHPCVFSGFRSEKDKAREHFPPKLSSVVRSEKDKENADLATGVYYA